MPIIPKFVTFKYKLSLLLFTVVLLISSFLGGFQYIIMRHSLVGSFEQNRKLTKDRIVNIVHDADYISLLMERPLEEESRKILDSVVAKYEAEKNIHFPLKPFIEGKKNVQLYIIDRKNTVIATTDNKDLGLNFTPWPDFAAYLEKLRQEKTFSASRMSLSVLGAEMTKYCYKATSDGEYIFETGTLLKEREQGTETIGFDNFEENLMRENKFVDRVILFDYEGLSYKKNEKNENTRVGAEYMSYFQQALETMKVVELVGEYEGRKAYYQYIPYSIIDARGTNERNVVEVIYNDAFLEENLMQNIPIILGVVGLGALIAASYGFYKARAITKPIEIIKEGIEQVSCGDLNFSFQVDSNDEFHMLGGQLNLMTVKIRKLLNERDANEKDLERKNMEISSQKEEITELFEEMTALNEELESLLNKNQNSYFETVRALANAIEEKDSYTRGHCERVMGYAVRIAEALGLCRQELNDIRFGSILHDIGKIGIPENVLNKESALTEEEFALIRLHPEKGDHILENLNFLEDCRKIVREHHERIDGKGYPKGLKGDQINLQARIVCVADAYDAMTSIRPYRKQAMSKEEAVQELLDNKGRQFDEEIVDIFIKCLSEEA